MIYKVKDEMKIINGSKIYQNIGGSQEIQANGVFYYYESVVFVVINIARASSQSRSPYLPSSDFTTSSRALRQTHSLVNGSHEKRNEQTSSSVAAKNLDLLKAYQG